MRDPDRILFFMDRFTELWQENLPDWRFGQLMVNFMRWYGDPFYLEDFRFLDAFEEFIEVMKQ